VYGFSNFLELAETTVEEYGDGFEGAKIENFG